MLTNPQQFLKSLPNKPGVYQMFDSKRRVIYVGKANNLKKRLSSYFRSNLLPKTAACMLQVVTIEIIITANENAALLLEHNLIKNLRPRYNVLFKDDKSFPYLFLSEHKFPRLSIHRGSKKLPGKYFGPYPHASAVYFTYNLLQKIFKLRVCSDNFFHARTRACILYQIKRCSGPCVGHIDESEYAKQVQLAEQFLNNKSQYVIGEIEKLMDQASAAQKYEQAAVYRDQIISLRKIAQGQQVIMKDHGNYDVIAAIANEYAVCINILFVRGGLVVGNKSYFPETAEAIADPGESLTAFIMQRYLQAAASAVLPEKILVNIKLPDIVQLNQTLQEKFPQLLVQANAKGASRQLLQMAVTNAEHALKTRFATTANYYGRLLSLQEALELPIVPARIECFDVSHTMGEYPVASCVVFDSQGPSKSNYRRYNIKNAKLNDDYGALHEALTRRLQAKENLPDVLMLDGGKGQLHVGMEVLEELGINNITLLAIAKGPERRPGNEEIFLAGKEAPIVLTPTLPALHFMQQIRDEAHRFAITGHRKKLAKARKHSTLETVPGVGAARSVALLKHFGGLQELERAGIDDFTQVKGINRELAQRIYEYLHG